jgi:hypothetical protein
MRLVRFGRTAPVEAISGEPYPLVSMQDVLAMTRAGVFPSRHRVGSG